RPSDGVSFHHGRSSSALPPRTIESRATTLDDPPDRVATGAAGAGPPLTVIHRPGVLEPACLSRGLDVVARRRAAGSNRARQHVLDGHDQTRATAALHG